MKHKWESIYERFKDAHLIKQDEIYLGRGKEKIRLLRDNGVIRALKGECSFGSFHIKEEDLDAVERELRRASGEDVDALMPPAGAKGKGQSKSAQDAHDGSGQGVDSDEDELGVWDPDFVRTQYREFDGGEAMRRSTSRKVSGGNSGADTSGSTAAREDSEDEEEDDRPTDPDLIAFLEAEAKRKEIMGGEEEDDEDEVVDFRSPRWTSKARWTGSGSTSESDSTSGRSSSKESESEEMQQRGPRRHKKGPATLHLDQPEAYESSEDEIDVLDPETAAQVAQQQQQHRKDPYRKMMEKKRRNVERLISRRGGNGTQQGNCGSGGVLPYDDIPGLAELLGVTAVADASSADTSGSTGSDVSHVGGDKTTFDDAEVVDAMLLSQETRATPGPEQVGNPNQANASAATASDDSNNSFSSMVSVAVSPNGDQEQPDAISFEPKAHLPKLAAKAPSDSSSSASSSTGTGSLALSAPSPRSFGCSSSASDNSAKSPPTSPLVVTAEAALDDKGTVLPSVQAAVVPTAGSGHTSTEAGTDVQP